MADTSIGSSSTTRTIINTGAGSASTDLVQSGTVTAPGPQAVSRPAEGPPPTQSGATAANTLVSALGARGAGGGSSAVTGAQTFVNSLGPTAGIDIRTIVPTFASGGVTNDPIVITGSAGGTQVEAFVIDMRAVAGKLLQVNNIEFVSIIGAATVTGGGGSNFAVGDGDPQFISLGEDDDTLYGGGGNDTVGSADGDDLLYGEDGADVVIGGTGSDSLFGGGDADVLYGNRQADVLYGNLASDTLYGGQDADVAYGGQDADLAYGNLGEDVLYGNLGADTLFGGQDNDRLAGNLGADTLYGGRGDDVIYTGSGADLVVVQASGGADTVADFDGTAGDRIRISGNANGTAIDSYAELRAAAGATADGSVQFALGGGNTLTLTGIRPDDLQTDWFVFG